MIASTKKNTEMRMASSSCSSDLYDEQRALKSLLDAFGSSFSLKEIASVFCKAGSDPSLAGKMLYGMQNCNDACKIHPSDADSKCEISSVSSSTTGSEGSCYIIADANCKASKIKQRAVSMGSITSVLGKTYLSSTPSFNGTTKEKPVVLDVSEVMPVGSSEECTSVKDAIVEKDFENFLLEMLGSGFQLDRDALHEVLGQCGYDMEKSLEALLDRTTKRVDRRDTARKGIIGESATVSAKDDSAENGGITNGSDMPGQQDKRYEQQKEILASLFNAPERPTEPERPPKVRGSRIRRAGYVGALVDGPLVDPFEESGSKTLDMELYNIGDKDDTYAAIRQAVEEYRSMMKEYYKAAAEAFAKGEKVRARTLLEQGQFFHEKARQADEESAQRIFEISGKDCAPEEAVLSLDLKNHDPKGAIQLLKCHLRSLSGIPSFTHLKIIIGVGEDDASRKARRRLVLKLLDRESIKWTEGEASGTISIRLDEINPKQLSFLKKEAQHSWDQGFRQFF
ncbi:putative nuclear RNA export factor SDE5 [Drosera capensis]